jgi:hypothetical protein
MWTDRVSTPPSDGRTELGRDPDLISDGLAALERMLAAPAARRALSGFQADLAGARNKLACLFGLQRMLASFQELAECHDDITAATQALARGVNTWPELLAKVSRAMDLSASMVDAADAGSWAESIPLWAGRLRASNGDLPAAVIGQDLETLEAVIDRHKRAVSLGRIYTGARMLRVLEELLIGGWSFGLSSMWDTLTRLDVDQAPGSRMAEFLPALERVCGHMQVLSWACIGWRELLHEVRYVADQCTAGVTENLDRAWADVSATSRRLLALSGLESARYLDAIDAELQTALDESDFQRAVSSFGSFHAQARRYRRAAEERLSRAVCELERVNAPLMAVTALLAVPPSA